MDWAFIQRSVPELWDGLIVTMGLSAVAVTASALGGLPVAYARLACWRPLRLASGAYVEVMRDTPILVQLAVLYFGLPTIGLYPDGFTSAAIALGLQNAAYTGEIYRGGIASVSPGQREAAAALGMHRLAIEWCIVLPQAFRQVIPALGNQAVMIIKDTSVASTVALAELTLAGKLLLDRSAAPYETFLLIAVLYLALNAGVLTALKAVALRFPVRPS